MTDSIEGVLYNLDEETTPHLILTEEIGEGEVHIGRDFQLCTSLQQADLLEDWIEKLQEMYDSVVKGEFLADLGASAMNNPPGSGSMN